MSELNVIFQKIECFKEALQTELLSGKTSFKQPLDKNEHFRRLNHWLNLLTSKVALLTILGEIGNQRFPTNDSSDATSLVAALKNLVEIISTQQLETSKVKLAALSSVITTIAANKETEHIKIIELLEKKHELELDVEELSKQHCQVLENLVRMKKEMVKEINSFKSGIDNDAERLEEMKESEPFTVTRMKQKTQQLISKANTARNFISTIIVAGDVSLIEKPELLDMLIKQRKVLTLDNIKNF